jgi:hypothetical protein
VGRSVGSTSNSVQTLRPIALKVTAQTVVVDQPEQGAITHVADAAQCRLFQLHAVGPIMNLGLFFWGLDRGTDALSFSRDFIKDVPDNSAPFIAGLSAPPAPFVPTQYHFARGYALLAAGFGSAEEHARIVAPIRQAVPPAFELVTPIRQAVPPAFELVTPILYTQLQQLFNGAAPWGLPPPLETDKAGSMTRAGYRWCAPVMCGLQLASIGRPGCRLPFRRQRRLEQRDRRALERGRWRTAPSASWCY